MNIGRVEIYLCKRSSITVLTLNIYTDLLLASGIQNACSTMIPVCLNRSLLPAGCSASQHQSWKGEAIEPIEIDRVSSMCNMRLTQV